MIENRSFHAEVTRKNSQNLKLKWVKGQEYIHLNKTLVIFLFFLLERWKGTWNVIIIKEKPNTLCEDLRKQFPVLRLMDNILSCISKGEGEYKVQCESFLVHWLT
jgi:hypothetical protein